MRQLSDITLAPETRDALADFHQALRQHFGERLREACLFGSQARGDAGEDSDVDVLVVIDDAWRNELETIMGFCADILYRRDVIIEPRLFPTRIYRKYQEQERPLVVEIEREGARL
jgi:predicted nucleotidyltransferase